MPISYLVGVAVIAVHTFCAVAPPRPAHTTPVSVSFLLGWIVNELPFFGMYWLALAIVPGALQGDVNSPIGWVAAVLAVATAVGLIVVIQRAARTPRAVGQAMAETFGAQWRGSIRATGTAVLPWLRILLFPIPVLHPHVKRVRNVRYGDGGRRHLLDVYRHRSCPSDAPVLIHLHGLFGRKSVSSRRLLHRFARRGWVCVSANYRPASKAGPLGQLHDVKRVIAWVRRHGAEHGADPGVIFVSGSSLGGHLAAMAALTPNDPALQPGLADVDTAVTAAVLLYPFLGSLDAGGRPLSPFASINPDAPPFFIAHGDNDTIVLVEDAREFADRLRATSSNPVLFVELPGGQHNFDWFTSIRFERVIDGVEAFAACVRVRAPVHEG